MGESRRYDDQSYVEAWKTTGEWPPIHARITRFLYARGIVGRYCDLGSSTGLLGERLRRQPDGFVKGVCAIEADEKAVARGRDAGVEVPTLLLTVNCHTAGQVLAWLRRHQVDVLLARRVFPEILGRDPRWWDTFARMLVQAGVQHVILEGRLNAGQSDHPLRTAQLEADALAPWFDFSVRQGYCVHLRRRRTGAST